MEVWSATIIGGLLGLLQELGPTIVGTLAGAWLAFWFERSSKASHERASQRAAGQRALFALASQATVLKNLLDNALNKYRQRPDRTLSLPHLVGAEQGLFIRLDELLFLLESEDPNILFRILNAERSYRTAMNTLEHRNTARLAVEEVMGRQGIPGNTDFETALRMLPPHLPPRLRTLTDGLYEMADDAYSVLVAAIEELEEALRKRFPKEPTIQLKLRPIGSDGPAKDATLPPV